jgi:crotonobetainyl-CoA:carnitine CoA-transferase CaiB-like acyl-CoA transferase
MSAPLEGIRVVEIASYVAAPAAGALLADLGAEVIKVEVPHGEVYRYARPRLLGMKSDFPEAPHFHMDNRGKRSLALDLTRQEAQAALARVIDGADVVLTNMLPERLRRYGLDADSLRAAKPALIVAALSGYGSRGEEASRPAFDYAAYWARTGFMDVMRDAGAAPSFQRPGIGDHAAALALVSGILAALRMRDRSGEGQVVEVSLQHIGFYVDGNDAAVALATGESPPRHDRERPRNPLWNHYRTADDRWLFLCMIESDPYWSKLCTAIGRPDLDGDPRYADARGRYRHAAELTATLAADFAAQPLAEWERRLAEHGVIWAPVRTLAEAIRDPQARANGVFRTVHHPAVGAFETVAPPLRLSAHEMRAAKPAPELGADNEAVLRAAGLSEDEIRNVLSRRSG